VVLIIEIDISRVFLTGRIIGLEFPSWLLSGLMLMVIQVCSEQPDVAFHGLDHRIHLAVPYLLGNAQREAFGGVERNM
jgi:hypothetical protein